MGANQITVFGSLFRGVRGGKNDNLVCAPLAYGCAPVYHAP